MAEKSHLYRGSSIRAYDAEYAYQKELQKRVREVEVRAMQEVVELRQSRAAAQLDAQEQRRQFTATGARLVQESRHPGGPVFEGFGYAPGAEAPGRHDLKLAVRAQFEVNPPRNGRPMHDLVLDLPFAIPDSASPGHG